MKNALARTKQTCIATSQAIAATATHIAAALEVATTEAAVEEVVIEANSLRSQAIELGRHAKYLRRQLTVPVVNTAARAKQLGADVPSDSLSLANWTAAAIEVLRSQGHDPIGVGHHRNQLAWRDADGQTHTLVFDWYDKKSRCVRMYLDHYTVTVSKAKAKLLGLSHYIDADTSVPPHSPNRLEVTTLPAEMSKALVWALSGRVGVSPYVWVKFGEINIHTQAAVEAYRAAWPKK